MSWVVAVVKATEPKNEGVCLCTDRNYYYYVVVQANLLELPIVSHTPVMRKPKSLRVGTAIGVAGFVFGLLLAWFVAPVDTNLSQA